MKTLTGVITLMLVLLFGASNGAAAAEKAAAPAAKTTDHLDLNNSNSYLKKITGKVTQVDTYPTKKTFTIVAKGQPYTFSAAGLKALPKVGEVVDVEYTGTGGLLAAKSISLNSSRSNIY